MHNNIHIGFIPRKPMRLVTGLSLAAVLALSALTPAHAAETVSTSTEELSKVTNGSETEQVKELLPEEAVLETPQLSTAPPVNGDGNPGATLGQGIKALEETSNLSEESLEQAEEKVKLAQKGVDVVDSQQGGAPATTDAVSTEAASFSFATSATTSPTALGTLAQAASTQEAAVLDNPLGTIRAQTSLAKSALTVHTVATSPTGSGVLGMDVSGWQPSVNWSSEYSKGARFAYVKASEGITYTSPVFSSQYNGSRNVGMKRGAYHFAIPTASTGAVQARYFVANGGGWTADGATLPGLLDIEYNPYSALGNSCYNMSASQLYTWVKDFTNTYKQLTGRYPAVYTTTDWWTTCIGSMADFNHLPLHVAAYTNTSSPGRMPTGYTTYDIWQYSSTGPFSGDSNVFNGTLAELNNFAANASYQPVSTQRALASSATQYTLRGAIGAYYYANGAVSTFGVPTGNEFSTRLNGAVQNFSKNRSIYWTEATGAHAVYWPGAIGAKFRANGYESGWGYPSTDEVAFWHGAKQHFRNGDARTAVYWSQATGAHTFNERGAIYAKWVAAGDVRAYGFPSTDEQGFWQGSRQFFANGQVVYWSQATGARTLNSRGAIYAKWAAEGDAKTYGFPVTDETTVNGVTRVKFSNGKTINWTAQRGVWVS